MKFIRRKASLISFFLVLLSIFVFGKPAYAFTDEEIFSFSIAPPSFTTLTAPGKLTNFSVTLINSNSKSQNVYPYTFDWDLAEDEFHYTSSSWLNSYKKQVAVDNNNDYPFNFSLTVPQSQSPTPAGEYYKVLTFSNKHFNTEESDNPAIMVGVPIITQVTSGELVGPLAKEDLYSQLLLTDFRSFFNPFTRSQTFRFQIKNEGNLSAVPTGDIRIKDSQGKLMETLPFNQESFSILPNAVKAFELSFMPERAFISELKAEVWLGYKNSLKEAPPEIVFSSNFFYVSPNLIFAIVVAIIIALLIERISATFFKPRHHYRYRYVGHLLILMVLVPLGMYLYKEIKTSEKILGEKKELQVTATVRQTTGIKVVLRNGQRVVIVTSSTPKGFKLYSLQGNKGKILDKSDNNYSGKREITLGKNDSRFPILILTNGF